MVTAIVLLTLLVVVLLPFAFAMMFIAWLAHNDEQFKYMLWGLIQSQINLVKMKQGIK